MELGKQLANIDRAARKTPLAVIAVFLFLLSACATPGVPRSETPPENSETPPENSRTLTTWTIDPDFDPAGLEDAEARVWYGRVVLEIASEREERCLPASATPEDYPFYPSSATVSACSGVKHYIGRQVNGYVTSLLTLFRVTGDRELLQEVDRVMEISKAQLRDTDGDGVRNWRWLRFLDQTDFNLKEDGLAHAFIPQVIYVFKQNAAYSTPEYNYAAHADEWLSYLRDEFEVKWAKQGWTAETEGLPVSPLFHPYIDMLRYTAYMAKLLPAEDRYRRLEQELATISLEQFKTDMTDNGEAFVWSHDVRQARGKSPDDCLLFQMGTYPKQTMQTFMDLALEGYPGFADAEALRKLSRTVSESILQPNDVAFMYKDVGGIRNGTMDPNRRVQTRIGGWCFKDVPYSLSSEPGDRFRSEGAYRLLTYGFFAAFATDKQTSLSETEIYQVNRQVYGDPSSAATSTSSVSIPAAMTFAHLYTTGHYVLGR